ncbi:MAG TPA: hypothetical protein ENJ12_00735 [Thiolapillus brandeum]|uniref:Uncharacterized protein n=1 Tax=Thiolapillus brandeum TaxID=1076588 RepID=A0A831RQX6_9GAMM|nr:hypothetical protein [Thiolapillus brandeum]
MNTRMPPFPGRDLAAEAALLQTFTQHGIDYAMLQRDWRDDSHGDLDIIVRQEHWPLLVERVAGFSHENGIPVVKAYEIERGVVCVVMLTQKEAIFLDTVIAGASGTIYGVDPVHALQNADRATDIPVISEEEFLRYRQQKKIFKASTRRKLLKKMANLPIILRRLIECTTLARGALLYVPYLLDTDILRSEAVSGFSHGYLTHTLRHRYRS